MDCVITTNPTGPQSLQEPDGTPYDAAAAAGTGSTGSEPTRLTLVQTLGEQTSPCIENPLPTRIENNTAITGGELP